MLRNMLLKMLGYPFYAIKRLVYMSEERTRKPIFSGRMPNLKIVTDASKPHSIGRQKEVNLQR